MNWYKKAQNIKQVFHEDDIVQASFRGKPYIGKILEIDDEGNISIYFDDYDTLSNKDSVSLYPLLEWMEKIFKENEIKLIQPSERWETFKSDLDLMKNEDFHYMNLSWDVREAKRILYKKPRQIINFPIKGVEYFINSGAIATFNKYMDKVDIKIPIIVISVINSDKSIGYFPIDGWHRIRKAIEENIETLPAYVLTVEESKQLKNLNK